MTIRKGQKRYKRYKVKKSKPALTRNHNEWRKVKLPNGLKLITLETVKHWCEYKGLKVYNEREVESYTHRKLRELSMKHFSDYGYKCTDISVTVRGCSAISDYYMTKNGKFFFVECLRKPDEKIIRKKMLLANYAPTWFVVPIPYGTYTAELTKQPVLEIDLSRGLCEPEKVMTETESTTYRRVYVDGMSTSSFYRQ
jgi:hypothetical protein